MPPTIALIAFDALPPIITRRPPLMKALVLRALLRRERGSVSAPFADTRGMLDVDEAFYYAAAHREEACVAELVRGGLRLPESYAGTCMLSLRLCLAAGRMLGAPPCTTAPAPSTRETRLEAARKARLAADRVRLQSMLEAAELDAEMAAVQTAALRGGGEARRRPVGGWGVDSSMLNLTLQCAIAGRLATENEEEEEEEEEERGDENQFDSTAWGQLYLAALDSSDATSEEETASGPLQLHRELWMLRVAAATAIADSGGPAWSEVRSIFDQADGGPEGELSQPDASAFAQLHAIAMAVPQLAQLCGEQCAQVLRGSASTTDSYKSQKSACIILLLLHTFVDMAHLDGDAECSLQHIPKPELLRIRNSRGSMRNLVGTQLGRETCAMWQRNALDLRSALGRRPLISPNFLE